MAEIYGIPGEWVLLAEDDKSEAYEVDIAAIYLDDEGRFVFATASGCSCWEGDYDTEVYDTMDALATGVVEVEARRWNYSPAGTEKLITEAREALPAVLVRLAEGLSATS